MDVSYISAVEASQPVQPPVPVAERRQLSQATRSVNASGMLGRNQLVIAVDSQTRRPVFLVEDRETHEVVLQVPPEYVLRLAEDLRTSSIETMPSPADM